MTNDAQQDGPGAELTPRPPADPATPDTEDKDFEAWVAMAQAQVGHENPVADKVTSEHITGMMALQGKAMDYTADDRKGNRRLGLQFFYGGGAFVIIMSALLLYTGNAAILENIVPWLVAMAIGGVGGYGFGRRNSG